MIPASANPMMMQAAAAAPAGDVVTKSVRFNAGDTPYLQRTTGTSSDQTKCTHSFWMKRSTLGANQRIFEGGSNAGFLMNGYSSSDEFRVNNNGSLAENTTTQLLRDTSAFYHICVSIDSALSSADQLKLYINGTRVTSFSRTDSIETNQALNPSGTYATIGKAYGGGEHFDGYLADYYMLDGVAAAATDFAEEDATTGQWKPKAYSGSYGDNGFHLAFENSSNLGLDSRGSGGSVAAWDTSKYRLAKPVPSWSQSNTQFDGVSGHVQHSISGFSGNGKYYAEFDIDIDSAITGAGVCPATWWTGSTLESYLHDQSAGAIMEGDGGLQTPNGEISTSFDNSNRLGIEVDAQANTATFYEVTSAGGRTSLYAADSTDGLDFADNVAWGASVYDGNGSVRGYFASSEWNGTPSTGYVATPTGNHFTATNLAASDVVEDTPTSNYCTLNPLNVGGSWTLSEGDLKAVADGSTQHRVTGTFAMASGKWYFECKKTSSESAGNYQHWGLYDANNSLANGSGLGSGSATSSEWILADDGDVANSGASSASGLSSIGQNDIVQIAVDMDTKKFWVGRNNTWDGDPAAGSGEAYSNLSTLVVPFHHQWGSRGSEFNFGQSDFTYTPPTGFKALSTGNLATPTIAKPSEYFDTDLWTGDSSSTRNISTPFDPAFVWIKCRSNSGNGADHTLWDSLRDVNSSVNTALSSSHPEPEGFANDITTTSQYGGVSVLGTNLYTLKAGASTDGGGAEYRYVNETGRTYVGWSWRAGSTDTNEVYNADSGFSIVKWTGDDDEMSGDAQRVSHHLGVAPELILAKNRWNNGSPDNYNWQVYHKDIGASKYLILNSSAAEASYDTNNAIVPYSTTDVDFRDDMGMSDTIYMNQGSGMGSAETYVAYLFASVEGYSKVGSYTGNNSVDGSFVYTGFRPAFVLVKSISTSYSWYIFDSKREPSNVMSDFMLADSDGAEQSYVTLDFNSNGFKFRTTGVGVNGPSTTDYIYYAVAESPFKYANAR